MIKTTFPNGTIPITTCQCERSVSALSVHRNMNISENEIIDKFAIMHPMRMKMIDIFHFDISVKPK